MKRIKKKKEERPTPPARRAAEYDPTKLPPTLVAVRQESLLVGCRERLIAFLDREGFAHRELDVTPESMRAMEAMKRFPHPRTADPVKQAGLAFFEALCAGTYLTFVLPAEPGLTLYHVYDAMCESSEWKKVPAGAAGEFPFKQCFDDTREGRKLLTVSGLAALEVVRRISFEYIVTYVRSLTRGVVVSILFGGNVTTPRFHAIQVQGTVGDARKPTRLTRLFLDEAERVGVDEVFAEYLAEAGLTGVSVESLQDDKVTEWNCPPSVMRLDATIGDRIESDTIREALDLVCMRVLLREHNITVPFARADEFPTEASDEPSVLH